MSFLAPWGLLLAAAVAVPLVLHLLRRRTGTRVEFPAVRYLLRAEKEHAREVRLRNLLLMMLRVAIVLALALAVARPIGPFPGTGHPPTAIVLVLDNSLSSTLAGSEGPLLSRLVEAARAVLARAAAGDAVTLVTMDGEVVGGATAALDAALARLAALDGAGD
ncbi:MAG: BatA domain-containing protein, partial [Gemmatimonadaceae bacterium]